MAGDGSWSRREFLKFTGLTLANMVLFRGERLFVPEKVTGLVWGLLLTRDGVDQNILDSVHGVASKLVPKGLDQYGSVNIAATAGYDYLIETAAGPKRLPLHQVLIMAGNPFPMNGRLNFLGIRNDIPELMPYIAQAGLGPVRIAGDVEEMGEPSSAFEGAIAAAIELKYRPLVVVNPRWPRPEAEIRAMVRKLVINNDVDVELLNEPNDPAFWQGDLLSAAETISIATNEIKKLRPKTRVIVAALTDPAKMRPFVRLLEQEGVNLWQVEFAVHGYQTPEMVEWMVRAVVAATGKAAVITEVGVRGVDKREMVPILDKVWQLRQWGFVSQAFIHELPDYEGWGYYSPYLKNLEADYYYLPAWVRLHS